MGTPLSTIAALRAAERAAQQDLPAGELMARAGRAAARWIDERVGVAQRDVLVVAGCGNNGGDGFVTARELRMRGHRVSCTLLGGAAPLTEDARAAFEQWRAAGGEVSSALPASSARGVIVDALFGIGLARPLSGAFAEAARWINAQRATVFALDVPSGLDADRGSWVGGAEGVRASATVTFIADKPGLHTGDGPDAAGAVVVDTLGVERPATSCVLSGPDDFEAVLQPRRRNTHKGSFGDVLVLGGAAGMVGAPLLAARAALRIGAGRVYVDCIGARDFTVDPVYPELMFRRYASLDGMHAVVVGCGLGTDAAAEEALRWSLATSAALVIDADGLNLLARTANASLAQRAAVTVLTPHPLEAARLLKSSAREVSADRLGAARALAGTHRCIVVLKGAGTVIADPHGRAAINPTGGPSLSTAGTGDVLAGLLGGLLAQGYEAWQATLAAVWLHGAAAPASEDRGLVAGELPLRVVDQLHRLRAQRETPA